MLQQRTTLPPPPDGDPIAELEAQERKFAHRASRALEKARECRAQIDFLRGTPRNDSNRGDHQ
jgi:hypothetical protein